MKTKTLTATPAELMVEQLAADGINYVFYNSGSREAPFFDALQNHTDVHGILALHEGNVSAMSGGYAQAKGQPAVMVVHLGAGLAQCLGQLINVWRGGLPVVVITFAGDTGSYGDDIILDLDHNFGPTSISAPFVKASWAIIEGEGLPQALHRALQVATTPPMGPVHLAIYDRLLTPVEVTSQIIEGGLPLRRAGYPADYDVEALSQILQAAKRPLLYVESGIWKSGAEAQLKTLVEHFALPVASSFQDLRSLSINHQLHCGRFGEAVAQLKPDHIICLGVRHRGRGKAQDFDNFKTAESITAIGSDVTNLTNMAGLDLAILADEGRTLARLIDIAVPQQTASYFQERRTWALEQAALLRSQRVAQVQKRPAQISQVRPWVLAEAIDQVLDRFEGGYTMIEQYAVPLDCMNEDHVNSRNTYIRAAGASEGYGVAATIGLKLAVPNSPVIGLVGDGSLYYADSGLWTAVHHQIPVLYIISNNQAYGIVASSFGRGAKQMQALGLYAGVVLDKIDPVKLAAGFGMEGRAVQDEATLVETIEQSLNIVMEEKRPYLLNVYLPLGLPEGGQAAQSFSLADS